MKNLRGAALVVVSLIGLIGSTGWTGCSKVGGGSVTPQTDDEKTLYAYGFSMGRNAGALGLSVKELEILKAGIGDAVLKKKAVVEVDKFGPQMDSLARKRMNERAEVEKGKEKGLIEAALKEPGAKKLAAGTIIKTTRPGNGAQPAETDRVKVHYEGRLSDGTVFDSSIKRGEPAVFPLNGVIKCWTEGLGSMKVGEKATVTCPSGIAYGDGGRPPVIPGGAVLIFDVELLDVLKTPPGSGDMQPPPGH